MPKKLNISDVARTAGVSTTTVSRVLNRIPTVTNDNRVKVEEAIRRLNFRPNAAARRLAAGKQQTTVGLIIPEFQELFQSFYAIEVVRGVGQGAQSCQVDILLHLAAAADARRPNIVAVDGLIFVDIYGQEEFLDQMLAEGMPCVVLNHYLEELPVSCIAIDNTLGAKQALDYLVGLGHKDIAIITGDLGTQVGLDRLDGFVRAMRSHNLTIQQSHIQRADYSPASARQAAEKLLALDDRPTAIFVASDEMAVAAIEVAQRKRVRVPEDLSIIGFDDNPLAAASAVPLTTVHQPLREMGSQGVRVLVETMQGKRRIPFKVRLPTQLIERQSCRQTWLPR